MYVCIGTNSNSNHKTFNPKILPRIFGLFSQLWWGLIDSKSTETLNESSGTCTKGGNEDSKDGSKRSKNSRAHVTDSALSRDHTTAVSRASRSRDSTRRARL